MSFALNLGSVLTVVSRRRRDGSTGCSLLRQNLLEFCSGWTRSDGRLLPRSRIGHLKDLPPDSYGAGFHALQRRRPGRTQNDATEWEFGHRKLRYDFGFWEFG